MTEPESTFNPAEYSAILPSADDGWGSDYSGTYSVIDGSKVDEGRGSRATHDRCAMSTFLGVWSGPWWLVVTDYMGTVLVAGLILFVLATVTGVAERLGEVPARLRARNERILREREARG